MQQKDFIVTSSIKACHQIIKDIGDSFTVSRDVRSYNKYKSLSDADQLVIIEDVIDSQFRAIVDNIKANKETRLFNIGVFKTKPKAKIANRYNGIVYEQKITKIYFKNISHWKRLDNE